MSGVQPTMSRREALHEWDLREPEKYVWLVDWTKYAKPYCSLYVVAPEGHWPSKVGISVKPEKRVRQLQTAHWKLLSVARCFWCSNVTAARALETKIHDTLDDDGAYLLGEWFDKPASETVEIIKFCAAVIGVEISDTIEDHEILNDIRERVRQEYRVYGGPGNRVTGLQPGVPVFDWTRGKDIA